MFKMKKLLIHICVLVLISVNALSADFCGCIKRIPVNQPITVTWDHDGATGYELKIVHYFYDGIETEIVETTEQFYTFIKFPKSSRHFEIQARAFNEKDGNREYSIWISSTDKNYAVFNDQPCGWLVYTTPGTPSW